MPIKNLDGSTYRLSSPNPVMKNQSFWKDYTLHNFNWKSETISQNMFIPLKITKQELQQEIIKKEEPKQIIQEQPLIIKTKIYCLPAIITERKDELYDEVYKKVKYGKPFVFDGTIIKTEDLITKFWTIQDIEKSSIIYPKTKEKRWWQISEKEEKTGGYLYAAVLSSETPSFDPTILT
jgi:hypothetical protein